MLNKKEKISKEIAKILPKFALSLPFWMQGKNLTALKKASEKFFLSTAYYLSFSLRNINALVADIKLVDLLAYERAIVRFKSESEDLYRKRVHFAFANAKDSGSKIGFERIFKRLGLGTILIFERVKFRPWDVIVLQIESQELAQNTELLQYIINQFGRTCRRYEWHLVTKQKIQIKHQSFTNSQISYHVKHKNTKGK